MIEINKSFTNVICQIIKLQNPFKDIIIYDGSPFAVDDNKEYKIKILKRIQENARKNCLIILKNLEQILFYIIRIISLKMKKNLQEYV